MVGEAGVIVVNTGRGGLLENQRSGGMLTKHLLSFKSALARLRDTGQKEDRTHGESVSRSSALIISLPQQNGVYGGSQGLSEAQSKTGMMGMAAMPTANYGDRLQGGELLCEGVGSEEGSVVQRKQSHGDGQDGERSGSTAVPIQIQEGGIHTAISLLEEGHHLDEGGERQKPNVRWVDIGSLTSKVAQSNGVDAAPPYAEPEAASRKLQPPGCITGDAANGVNNEQSGQPRHDPKENKDGDAEVVEAYQIHREEINEWKDHSEEAARGKSCRDGRGVSLQVVKLGALFEIDADGLPDAIFSEMKRARVVKVSGKTTRHVTVVYPSVQSVKSAIVQPPDNSAPVSNNESPGKGINKRSSPESLPACCRLWRSAFEHCVTAQFPASTGNYHNLFLSKHPEMDGSGRLEGSQVRKVLIREITLTELDQYGMHACFWLKTALGFSFRSPSEVQSFRDVNSLGCNGVFGDPSSESKGNWTQGEWTIAVPAHNGLHGNDVGVTQINSGSGLPRELSMPCGADTTAVVSMAAKHSSCTSLTPISGSLNGCTTERECEGSEGDGKYQVYSSTQSQSSSKDQLPELCWGGMDGVAKDENDMGRGNHTEVVGVKRKLDGLSDEGPVSGGKQAKRVSPKKSGSDTRVVSRMENHKGLATNVQAKKVDNGKDPASAAGSPKKGSLLVANGRSRQGGGKGERKRKVREEDELSAKQGEEGKVKEEVDNGDGVHAAAEALTQLIPVGNRFMADKSETDSLKHKDRDVSDAAVVLTDKDPCVPGEGESDEDMDEQDEDIGTRPPVKRRRRVAASSRKCPGLGLESTSQKEPSKKGRLVGRDIDVNVAVKQEDLIDEEAHGDQCRIAEPSEQGNGNKSDNEEGRQWEASNEGRGVEAEADDLDSIDTGAVVFKRIHRSASRQKIPRRSSKTIDNSVVPSGRPILKSVSTVPDQASPVKNHAEDITNALDGQGHMAGGQGGSGHWKKGPGMVLSKGQMRSLKDVKSAKPKVRRTGSVTKPKLSSQGGAASMDRSGSGSLEGHPPPGSTAAHGSKKKSEDSKESSLMKLPKDMRGRWSVERYKAAQVKLVEIMHEKGAGPGNPILRPALREEARRHIGDTGLLDHLLKHMTDTVVGNGKERFRRRHNSEGAMEYWLEDAQLQELRRSAGMDLTHPAYPLPGGGVWGIGGSVVGGVAKGMSEEEALEFTWLKENVKALQRDFQRLSNHLEKPQASEMRNREGFMEEQFSVLKNEVYAKVEAFSKELESIKERMEVIQQDLVMIIREMEESNKVKASAQEKAGRSVDAVVKELLENFEVKMVAKWDKLEAQAGARTEEANKRIQTLSMEHQRLASQFQDLCFQFKALQHGLLRMSTALSFPATMMPGLPPLQGCEARSQVSSGAVSVCEPAVSAGTKAIVPSQVPVMPTANPAGPPQPPTPARHPRRVQPTAPSIVGGRGAPGSMRPANLQLPIAPEDGIADVLGPSAFGSPVTAGKNASKIMQKADGSRTFLSLLTSGSVGNGENGMGLNSQASTPSFSAGMPAPGTPGACPTVMWPSSGYVMRSDITDIPNRGSFLENSLGSTSPALTPRQTPPPLVAVSPAADNTRMFYGDKISLTSLSAGPFSGKTEQQLFGFHQQQLGSVTGAAGVSSNGSPRQSVVVDTGIDHKATLVLGLPGSSAQQTDSPQAHTHSKDNSTASPHHRWSPTQSNRGMGQTHMTAMHMPYQVQECHGSQSVAGEEDVSSFKEVPHHPGLSLQIG